MPTPGVLDLCQLLGCRGQRARAVDLASLESVRPSVEQILHTTAAAKLLDAPEDNLLLTPIQSSVVPLRT